GWHSGMSSGVFLAAMMPAILATPRASPFDRPPARTIATVSGDIRTNPAAVASRTVGSFPETSTIVASPSAVTWESRGVPAASGTGAPEEAGHRRGEVGALRRQVEVGPQETLLVGGVPAAATVELAEQAALPSQNVEGIGELDLAERPGRELGEQGQDCVLQDVAAHDGDIGRRLIDGGFSTRDRIRSGSASRSSAATAP